MITINQDKALANQIEAIEASYAPKFQALKDGMATIMLADGATQSAKTADIQAQWQTLSSQMDLEILTAIGGV